MKKVFILAALSIATLVVTQADFRASAPQPSQGEVQGATQSSDIPMPTNATLISDTQTPVQRYVTIEDTQNPQQISEFYKIVLKKGGWKQINPQSFKKDAKTLTFETIVEENGKTIIILEINH